MGRVDKPRQAVVIIHGIGEQIPMETLRSFVDAIAPGVDASVQFERKAESKPDHLSPTLELRRMAVPGGRHGWKEGDWVATDFYELHWAHLMQGTAWHHVMAWLSSLMLRRPDYVPSRLKLAWWSCWILAAVTFLLLLAALIAGKVPSLAQWAAFGTIGGAVWASCRSTGSYFGLQYAGDAARYLNRRPENVGVRQAIRTAAIELLEKLHDDPSWRRYHRIIVVGHSLGSVIAYDALTHLWQRRHHPKQTFPIPPDPDPNDAAGDYRRQQAAMWRRQRTMGVQWKITDFVTLGSPLAHAQLLLAAGPDDLDKRTKEREYPTCPPQEEDDRDWSYGNDLLAATTGGRYLHHAALFACTRWTNLYFDRDIIGGKIRGLGAEIKNERLEPKGWFPHTKYWLRGEVDKLTTALDLQGWWTVPENVRAAIDAQERENAEIR
jgi:hypothetical protein